MVERSKRTHIPARRTHGDPRLRGAQYGPRQRHADSRGEREEQTSGCHRMTGWRRSPGSDVLQRTRSSYSLVSGPRPRCSLPHRRPTPLPPTDAPRELYIQRAFEMVPNTAPFNATGHPAMSLPCGMSQGLPIGLMLVGKYYDESTIYRAAAAFESAGDWTKM